VFEINDAFAIPDLDCQRLLDINVFSGMRFSRQYGPCVPEKRFGRIGGPSAREDMHRKMSGVQAAAHTSGEGAIFSAGCVAAQLR
jgi:hypothetical protein